MIDFDIVVVGGGHAGAEAARVAARGGARVAMVTMDPAAIGRMSCNPAIGGLAKGHLVKELDALGGLMPEATDASGIQFKVLNRSKGPAVQGPRAQCDRDLYSAAVQRILAAESNLTIVPGSVKSIETTGETVTGLLLGDGTLLRCRAAILTTGTFLHALMHSGEQKQVGGRWGEPSSEGLSDSLRNLGLRLGRLKTGTPPRILRDTADFARMEPQPGDDTPRPFSILTDDIPLPQVLCWMTYTSEPAHELIRANLHRAPMYSGQIQAAGPRYCPSIEDKVVRFAEKPQHHVFVEPEGLENPWLYLNGISTSLPPDVQDAVVHSLPGLENSVIARYGYAVEYDFSNPEQLHPTLQVLGITGLYLAGQINGTSGYEEAAAQGFVAGLNALQFVRNDEPFVLRRDQAYMAVMIDDLVTQGTEEPYRMFTSRAEHRLLLGCDSVYERLTPIAERLGIVDSERLRRVENRFKRVGEARQLLESNEISPSKSTLETMERFGIALSQPTSLSRFMQRPDLSWETLVGVLSSEDRFSELHRSLMALQAEEREAVINGYRYAGYLEKQEREAAKLRDVETLTSPATFDYRRPGLSTEIIEKLTSIRPATLGQASRIRGMTPAAIAILRMHLRGGRGGDVAAAQSL